MSKIVVAVALLAMASALSACVDRNQWWGESPRHHSPYSPDRDWDRYWDGDEFHVRSRSDWQRDWENRHERYWDRPYHRDWR
jgi:hypothetical protein